MGRIMVALSGASTERNESTEAFLTILVEGVENTARPIWCQALSIEALGELCQVRLDWGG